MQHEQWNLNQSLFSMHCFFFFGKINFEFDEEELYHSERQCIDWSCTRTWLKMVVLHTEVVSLRPKKNEITVSLLNANSFWINCMYLTIIEDVLTKWRALCKKTRFRLDSFLYSYITYTLFYFKHLLKTFLHTIKLGMVMFSTV